MAVVEEEINQSPMLELNARLGLPLKLSLVAQVKSNYIANYGILGLQWSFFNGDLSLSFGNKVAVWFGHLEMEAIRLKASGISIMPYLTAGIDYDEYLISVAVESQSNRMWTQTDERTLGKIDDLISGIAFDINIEQPLWHNHWVILGVKLNYVKFFYQSWLSYTTLDEYLLYPEFKFAFVL
jgi:hypothetical protein